MINDETPSKTLWNIANTTFEKLESLPLPISTLPTHECVKHGPHWATMHFSCTDDSEKNRNRVFCMYCFQNFLEAAGVTTMTPVKEKR